MQRKEQDSLEPIDKADTAPLAPTPIQTHYQRLELANHNTAIYQNELLNANEEKTRKRQTLKTLSSQTCLGTLAITLFIGTRKEIVNYFKVHRFSHNPHLFNINLSIGAVIILATIRTVASAIIKVDYIKYHHKEVEKKHRASKFSKCVVYINAFIAAAGIFIASYKTFHYYGVAICLTMCVYAICSSIYSSMSFAKPLLDDMCNWFTKAISKNIENVTDKQANEKEKVPQENQRKKARKMLYNIFFSTQKRRLKFLATTIGTITGSLFSFYSIDQTFHLALLFITSWLSNHNIQNYLWHISGIMTCFIILWVLIPRYALTFREEAKIEKQKEASQQIPNFKCQTPTKKLTHLWSLVENHKNTALNFISVIVFGLFSIIAIACLFVCSLVLSVGTYIGAQHILARYTFCTTASDIIFVIDFIYQIFCYYGTELSRKILNKLMHIPIIHSLFKVPIIPPESEEKQNNPISTEQSQDTSSDGVFSHI